MKRSINKRNREKTIIKMNGECQRDVNKQRQLPQPNNISPGSSKAPNIQMRRITEMCSFEWRISLSWPFALNDVSQIIRHSVHNLLRCVCWTDTVLRKNRLKQQTLKQRALFAEAIVNFYFLSTSLLASDQTGWDAHHFWWFLIKNATVFSSFHEFLRTLTHLDRNFCHFSITFALFLLYITKLKWNFSEFL